MNNLIGVVVMKIAMPVTNKSMEAEVDTSFGRASCFLIYDTDSQSGAFFDNTAALSQGGAGIKAAQSVVDSGAGAVLLPQCGENAASILKAANLKMYKTTTTSIMDNILAFAEGKLALLEDVHAGYHNHGGK